ncbi:hypothetical protein CP04DC42_0859 [Chlamydia psittaci 04DC42]|uniref:Uncharacterized protein n=1 Tax=Chlamydia psittaci 99DC5 TaxID=1112251 RepID=A0ABN0MNC7_CHLPS|nr:hypothetical protein B595_0480 [Chlamydia psittaci 84/55]AFS20544.1 hypothetical protein B598_0456 [Chlamydia psittaci GR9]AFS22061.1 hypothetical protein B599_0450 [Chlamydia psittaci MN]AFS22642.1 hypothetical protein B600_0482 [Chlamydia psittaci VS225]AFS24283.1 hypothetical protein B601_0456 [Chlamydia psittaci WS/RT/E30]AFS26415.1 hypothetical protein B603_0458 [Chlamydia psittaci WC]AFS26882.1 hypothetical protein B711_0479 [Chlamydia psittaci CP3]EPJ13172.1 hypothetical protein CP
MNTGIDGDRKKIKFTIVDIMLGCGTTLSMFFDQYTLAFLL